MVGVLSLHSFVSTIIQSVRLGAMILVVNASGQYWDGWSWSQQGKVFLSVAAATRSLCEEGEDAEQVEFLEGAL